MLRGHLANPLAGERHFRWRGGDVSRLEGLSDAVFAFALTLLVVSLEVPTDFVELRAAFYQLPAFALCFAMLLLCWYTNFLFHRRYGLEDLLTIVLTGVQLFLILFYVYPLKFLFVWLVDVLILRRPLDQTSVQMGVGDMPQLMLLYGAGFTGIFGLFALQHVRAWRLREALKLDERERFVTRSEIRSHVLSVAIGMASMGLAYPFPSLSGMIYMAMAPVQAANGYWTGRRLERMEKDSGPS